MKRLAYFELDEYLAFKLTQAGEQYIQDYAKKNNIKLIQNKQKNYLFTFREFSKYFHDVIDRDDIIENIIGLLN